MEKEVIKLESIFRDTNEGVNVLYDESGRDIGALLWTVDTEYGSVDARLITLGGTIWDNTLEFGLRIENWDGKGYLRDEKGKLEEFSNIDDGERIATKYILDILNEDIYIEK